MAGASSSWRLLSARQGFEIRLAPHVCVERAAWRRGPARTAVGQGPQPHSQGCSRRSGRSHNGSLQRFPRWRRRQYPYPCCRRRRAYCARVHCPRSPFAHPFATQAPWMLCLLGPPAVRLGIFQTAEPASQSARPARPGDARGPCLACRLADLIFGEAEDPRATLRWYLTYLRAQLPEPLRQYLVTAERIAFDAPTDVQAFQHGARRLLERPDDAGRGRARPVPRRPVCRPDGLGLRRLRHVALRGAGGAQAPLSPDDRRGRPSGSRAPMPATLPASFSRWRSLSRSTPTYEEGHSLLIDASEAPGHEAARGRLPTLPADPAAGAADRAARVSDPTLRTRGARSRPLGTASSPSAS